MKKALFLLSVMVIVAFGGFAQSAASLMENHNYEKANIAYLEILKENATNLEAIKNVAETFRLLNKNVEAIEYYKDYLRFSENAVPEIILNFAKTLLKNDDFGAAKKYFTQFLKIEPNNSIAKNYLEGISNRSKLLENPQNLNVRNVHFNTSKNEEQLRFKGDNCIAIISNENKNYVKEFLTKNGIVSKEQKKTEIEKTINGLSFYPKSNAGVVSFGNVIYDLVGEEKRRKKYQSEIKAFNLDTDFKHRETLNFNNAINYMVDPFIAPDGKSLFFAADLKDGFGGLDIYASFFDGEDWSDPVNLGSNINSEGNEISPTLHESGTLYFASDGKGGLGGFDIFYSEFLASNGWSDPKNIGFPINSNMDDFDFQKHNNNAVAYFTSNRTDGKGGNDIYEVVFFNPVATNAFVIDGFVYDKENNETLSNAIIEVFDDNNIISTLKSDKNGAFKFYLNTYKDLVIRATKNDFKKAELNMNGKYLKTLQDKPLNIYLEKNDGNDILSFTKKVENESIDLNKRPDLKGKNKIGKNVLLIKGMTVNRKKQGILNAEVVLIDAEGKIVDNTTCDENGIFEFLVEKKAFYKIKSDAVFFRPKSIDIQLKKSQKESDFFILVLDKDRVEIANAKKEKVEQNNDKLAIAVEERRKIDAVLKGEKYNKIETKKPLEKVVETTKVDLEGALKESTTKISDEKNTPDLADKIVQGIEQKMVFEDKMPYVVEAGSSTKLEEAQNATIAKSEVVENVKETKIFEAPKNVIINTENKPVENSNYVVVNPQEQNQVLPNTYQNNTYVENPVQQNTYQNNTYVENPVQQNTYQNNTYVENVVPQNYVEPTQQTKVQEYDFFGKPIENNSIVQNTNPSTPYTNEPTISTPYVSDEIKNSEPTSITNNSNDYFKRTDEVGDDVYSNSGLPFAVENKISEEKVESIVNEAKNKFAYNDKVKTETANQNPYAMENMEMGLPQLPYADGIMFSIQIGAFEMQKNANDEFLSKAKRVDSVFLDYHENLFKYMVGNFKNMLNAQEAVLNLRKLGLDGFIVGFIKGRRM